MFSFTLLHNALRNALAIAVGALVCLHWGGFVSAETNQAKQAETDAAKETSERADGQEAAEQQEKTPEEIEAQRQAKLAKMRYQFVADAYEAKKAGDHALASTLFKKALAVELSPEVEAAQTPSGKQIELALYYTYNEMGDKIAALEYLKTLVKRYPKDEMLVRELGYKHLKRDEKREAVKCFDALCETDKAPKQDCMQAMFLYRDMGKEEDVLRLLLRLKKRYPQDAEIQREIAFLHLREQRDADALKAFYRLVELTPEDVSVRRQIAYIHIRRDEKQKAADILASALSIEPDNHAMRLELAYLYLQLEKKEEATAQFKLVANQEEDKESQEKAKRALGYMYPEESEGKAQKPKFDWKTLFWGDLYLETFFTSRFPNLIFTGRVREGIKTPVVPLRFYLGLRFTRDIKSKGGEQPAIYADNFLIPHVGVDFSPLAFLKRDDIPWLVFFYEFGYAIALYDRKEGIGDWDQRGGAAAGYEWMHTKPDKKAPPPKVFTPWTYFGEAYTDIVWYSRFDDNWIGYLKLINGVNVVQWHKERGIAQLYLRGNLMYDTNKVFYNNFFEFGPGFRVRPWEKWLVTFYAEYYMGFYIQRNKYAFNPLQYYFNGFNRVGRFKNRTIRNDDNPFNHKIPYHDVRIGVQFFHYW